MDLSAVVDISPYEWQAVLTAIFCGAVIGVERQLRGKPVGIRTSTLITLGTYLFLKTSLQLEGELIDHSRVIGQVVTGIGFLGAGVMLARDGLVVGVTSAAAIWVLASIGVAISMDHHAAAIKLSFLVVLILYGVEFLEGHIKALSRGVHAQVVRISRKGRTGPDDTT